MLSEFPDRYPGIDEWCEVARSAAIAHVAFETHTGAPRTIIEGLRKVAADA